MSLVISATTLGDLALANFCPRCFWIKLKCERLPFQTPLPGIFSSIDSYLKNVVRRYYEREQRLPPWFPDIGPVVGQEKVPGYTRFSVTLPRSGATLRGVPDDVFRLEGPRYHIVDYKTSRFTAAQDMLFLKYQAQLNVYAYIGQRTFFSPVTALSLIYLDPDTNFDFHPNLLSRSQSDLMLGFTPRLRRVEVQPDSFVEELMERAREIDQREVPPHHTTGCPDCVSLEQLMVLARLGSEGSP
ncbi:MAG: PD-(D/E)XK nuclease family protein [Dehalococcoidia bacterium]